MFFFFLKEPKGAVYKVSRDGFYILNVHISPENGNVFKEAKVHVEMKGTYGYLSAANWPLLPVNTFYMMK